MNNSTFIARFSSVAASAAAMTSEALHASSKYLIDSKNRSFRLIMAFLLFLMFLGNIESWGQTQLLGTTIADSGPSTLVKLDPNTGALINTIGNIGYRVNGLEYNAASGILYGTTANHDPAFPNGLITINIITGDGTPVGASGMLVNLVTSNSAGNLFAWTELNDDLVTINSTTGAATVVGESGISTARHGLDFNQSDVLYLVNGDSYIYTVNPATGQATYTGNSLGVTAHHGKFHPVTGKYWGINVAGSGPKNFIVADLNSGIVENIFPTVNNLFTITFINGGCTYTTIASGPYNSESTWPLGCMPPNPIPQGTTVTIDHDVTNPVGTTLTNNGTMTIGTGGSFINYGTYQGTGTFQGNFIDNGTVKPGNQ